LRTRRSRAHILISGSSGFCVCAGVRLKMHGRFATVEIWIFGGIGSSVCLALAKNAAPVFGGAACASSVPDYPLPGCIPAEPNFVLSGSKILNDLARLRTSTLKEGERESAKSAKEDAKKSLNPSVGFAFFASSFIDIPRFLVFLARFFLMTLRGGGALDFRRHGLRRPIGAEVPREFS